MSIEKKWGDFVDKVFSMKKATFYLLLIFFLGFILRFIAAVNLEDSADAMHFVTHAINFLSADRLITYDQSSGLWFAFTSVIYNIFGTTQLASRIAALIFGSFTILVIYLLTREFFSEKVSLIAAFLLAVAPFHITSTLAEMDVMAMFFSLLGMLFFVKALKNNKKVCFFIGGLFLGMGVYTKVYPLLFVPSLLLYFIYFNWKRKNKIITSDNIKRISIFLLMIFIFSVPALTHNYLLYQDKGFLDLQFTRTTGLGKNISGQYYDWDFQFNAKNSWTGLIFGDTNHIADGTPLLLAAVYSIKDFDPVNFFLGLIGMLFILLSRKEYRNYVVFFLLCNLFALPFLASIIFLPKHFLFFEILLIPMGALILGSIESKIRGNSLKIMLIAVLASSLILVGLPSAGENHFYGKNHITQLIDFKNDKIDKNSLVIVDNRIYRGRANWIFNDRAYLEGVEFMALSNQQENLPGELVPVNTYYIECVLDDCGWGTIKDQPELNEAMEILTDSFKESGQIVGKITEPDQSKPYYPIFSMDNRVETIKIYNVMINVKESFLATAVQPRQWFLYTIGYNPVEEQFDYYKAKGIFGNLINAIAHWIVWIATILAFLSPLYVFYLLSKK